MKKSTTLLFSLLLVCTSLASANRPGLEDRTMEDQSAMTAEPTASVQQPVTQHTSGDVLEITQGETIDIKPLNFPSRGMSMKKVLNELGKPKQTPPAVGNPPIRLWVYDDRTVYFEGMTVIHVVAKP